jgi:hypothetical protein
MASPSGGRTRGRQERGVGARPSGPHTCAAAAALDCAALSVCASACTFRFSGLPCSLL